MRLKPRFNKANGTQQSVFIVFNEVLNILKIQLFCLPVLVENSFYSQKLSVFFDNIQSNLSSYVNFGDILYCFDGKAKTCKL